MTSARRGVVYQQIDRLYREGTLAGLGDSQLLERYLNLRDEAAFEALVSLHGPMVLGLCRRVLRDPRDIEDAFQATFLVLVKKAPTIRDRGLLSNWLFGVAYRVAHRARANTLRRREREITVARLEAQAPSEEASGFETLSVLDQELSRMPRKYRAPLILCYLNGRTHDQAAEELGCPVGTVRSRLARGRDLLRRRLTSRGHAPTAAIFGPNDALPATVMTEAVPPALAAATIEAAHGLSVSKTITAGAVSASALVLTEGVLTTMKLSQLRWLLLAIVATGLSVGSVATITYARGQAARETATAAVGPLENAGKSGDQPAPLAQVPVIAQARGPSRRIVDSMKLDSEPTITATPSSQAIRKLQVELEIALIKANATEKLFKSNVISSENREIERGNVRLITATLQGLDDEIGDDLDRLKLEVKKRKAELVQAMGEKEMAIFEVARNRRLNEQKAGIVDDYSVARAEGALKSTTAQCDIKKVEIEEVELRVDQLQRRRNRIKEIIKLADQPGPGDPGRGEKPAQ